MKNNRICAFADEAGETLTVQIAAMKRNGIELLELRSADGKNVTALTEAEAREIRRRLDGEGISVWSLGSPIGKVGLEKAEKQFENFPQLLELAHILGAKRIRIFSFFTGRESGIPDFGDRVIEELYRLYETAENESIMLCHENEKGIFGSSAENCLRIHKEIPGIRAVFDPANFVQCGVDTLAAWELLSEYVEYMHIKDAMPDGKVVPAGRGEGNIVKIIGSYLAGGGEVMTLEPHLFDFRALKNLEKSGNKTVIGNVYATADDAFDAAAEALRVILSGLEL